MINRFNFKLLLIKYYNLYYSIFIFKNQAKIFINYVLF